MARVSIVAAMDPDRVIGRDGGLPWRLPEDLKRFRALTMGKPVVMGRKTHASIGRALDGRRNLVVSRQGAALAAPGCEVVASLAEALDRVADAPEVMVIGGARIYGDALARAERMYLTLLDEHFGGDVRFPAYDPGEWVEVAREEHRGTGVAHPHVFVILERRTERSSPPGSPAPGR